MKLSYFVALTAVLSLAACLDRKTTKPMDDGAAGDVTTKPGTGGAGGGDAGTKGDSMQIGDGPAISDSPMVIADGVTAGGGAPGTGGNLLSGTGGLAGAGGNDVASAGGSTGTGGSSLGTGGVVAAGGSVTTGLGGAAGTGGFATGGIVGSGGGAGEAAGGAVGSGGASTGGGVTSGGGMSGGVTGTGGRGTGGASIGGSTGDVTPPVVTVITPANGAKGVLSSSNITISFSEAMNTSATASAISVSGLLASDLSLAWSSAGTSVTITPSGGLVYATGTSPAVSPKSYTITVGTAAMDLAGNAMTTAFSASFTTLKRITYVMSPSIAYQTDTFAEERTDCADPLRIGGWSGTYSGGTFYSYMVFDLRGAGLPSSMYSIESARLYATQTADYGGFYAMPGHVELWRLEYQGTMNLSVFPVLADVGTLASAATPAAVSIDTLSSFKTDFVSNGATELLFKIAPVVSGTWAGVQNANFTCGFHLDMIYLAQ